MRQVMLAVLVWIGACLPAVGAEPAPKLSVEVRTDKDAKFAKVQAVLSAVRKSAGVEANIALRVQDAGGISARIRVSPEARYSDLFRLLNAVKGVGVSTIILVVK
jgi:biopolymer transport protein ExbD